MCCVFYSNIGKCDSDSRKEQKMNIIDSFSGQGSPLKNNEDIWGHSRSAAWIFDGATGLAKDNLVAADGHTDPHWLVHTADKSLQTHADKIEDMHALYAAVLRDCENAFFKERTREPRAPYELPMAASIVIRMFHGRVFCGALSDCTMLIETEDGLESMPACEKHAKVDNTSKALMLDILKKGIAVEDARSHMIPHLQANRRLANAPGGYDVFAPESRLADRVRIQNFKPAKDGCALLMTDGFYALVENYKAYDDAGLLTAARHIGLEALYNELREIEDDDHGMTQFPRMKKSDDATAVLIGF